MKSEKARWMTKKDIHKMQNDIEQKAIILFMAYMMDEEGYTDEKVKEMWHKLEEWLLAINKHLISVEQVREIIRQERGWEIQ
jgi:DNA-directed RNA polymerase specialized sigma54-like protein